MLKCVSITVKGTFASERSQNTKRCQVVLIVHDPFVLCFCHRLHVYQINLRPRTVVFRYNGLYYYSLRGHSLSPFLALHAKRHKQIQRLVCYVGKLLAGFFDHFVSASMSNINVHPFYGIKHFLNCDKIYWILFSIFSLSN